MMRALYTIAWILALPLVLARLWWRGRREPGYRAHLGERLASYARSAQTLSGPCIWLHAVSVGETRAAEPLIRALLSAYPDHHIVLTHMTPTGRATGQALFGDQPRVQQAYLPYDIGILVARFVRHFRPRLCILMETEVWPNIMAVCARAQLPVILANARLSARSLRKAHRLAALMRPAALRLSHVAAQTDEDALRLAAFGAPRVCVTGSIKFDVTPPALMLERGAILRAQIGARPVLLCASTRDGEEALLLDALARQPLNDALLIVVPRHPQRFDEVERLLSARGHSVQRRSTLGSAPLSARVNVLLGDSMGEMFAYFAACDVAFIGGSLLPLGGQNLIEACAVGKPVLVGRHTFNFAAITEDAVLAGAALRCKDAPALIKSAQTLLADEAQRSQMGEKARAFAFRHRGATERTMALLREFL